MDKTQFWQLIEASQNKKRDCEKQAAKLEKLLGKLTADELVQFDNIFESLLIESYRWDLWGVAYIVGGGCSDDGFEYFRCWLIAQGQSYFERALEEPERAADAASFEEAECEDIRHAANHAYEGTMGRAIPAVSQDLNYPDEPVGKSWNEEELEALYPRLWKKFE